MRLRKTASVPMKIRLLTLVAAAPPPAFTARAESIREALAEFNAGIPLLVAIPVVEPQPARPNAASTPMPAIPAVPRLPPPLPVKTTLPPKTSKPPGAP